MVGGKGGGAWYVCIGTQFAGKGVSLCGCCSMRALVPHAALVGNKFPGGVEGPAGYENMAKLQRDASHGRFVLGRGRRRWKLCEERAFERERM